MIMPNFLIIGAAKAGTTSLYEYLKQHPQIYMSPVKETDFFVSGGEKLYLPFQNDKNNVPKRQISKIEDYCALFQGVSNEIAVGEASPVYLYKPIAVERIKSYIPNAKLIAILRHPVDRAYSHFLHNHKCGFEPLTNFVQALQEEEILICNKWSSNLHYKQTGLYYSQLKRYFDTFARTQIKVYLYEELNANIVGVIQDIFRFLGVDNTFVPDMSSKHNVSIAVTPKNKILHSLLTKENPLKAVVRPFISAQMRHHIANV